MILNKKKTAEIFSNGAPDAVNSDTAGRDDDLKKGILAAILRQGEDEECNENLAELERLFDTAGGKVTARVTQMRSAPDAKTVIGSGKLAEMAELCRMTGAEVVIFDDELSPAQIREIEAALGDDVRVIDRSMLILDIFAAHAKTSEGRLQVEVAQLKYTAPRLAGHGKDMSRLGGGIGTRGPGESKLEIDRRRIRQRLAVLEAELERVEQNRMTMRQARDRSGIAKCAIVGYTNAGKSTLLNRLTDAGVLAEDKLFATLDPTTRQYTLPEGTKVLLTDTVGFIRKLPHHLIKAFKSTLDEVSFTDIILVVADASDSNAEAQLEVTSQLLTELNAGDKPVLYVFNKCDLCGDKTMLALMKRTAAESDSECVFISALTGDGIDELGKKLESMTRLGKRRVKLCIPQTDGGIVAALYNLGESVNVDYRDDGIFAEATLDSATIGKLKKYITE